tara:strand:- start:926 stop:1126 length:201 start_codon:yes stop_codon:yes gene_type:complete
MKDKSEFEELSKLLKKDLVAYLEDMLVLISLIHIEIDKNGFIDLHMLSKLEKEMDLDVSEVPKAQA